jgi:hypothetical protein
LRTVSWAVLFALVPALGVAQTAAPVHPSPVSGWFGGAEAGVAMYRDPHLNNVSGALRLGHSLERRGILRAAVVLSGAAVDPQHLGFSGVLEFRPLSPHRITPILGAGGGWLFPLFDDSSTRQYSYVFLTAGVAARVGGAVSLTLRGLYGNGQVSGELYSVHLGFEIGR